MILEGYNEIKDYLFGPKYKLRVVALFVMTLKNKKVCFNFLLLNLRQSYSSYNVIFKSVYMYM